MSVRYLATYGNLNTILAYYNTAITNNWDNITLLSANKANKTDLAVISQTGTSSTQAITKDTFFYLNDKIAQALINIPSGVIFAENTNYKLISDGALNELINNLAIVSDRIPFKFGINSDNKYGFCKISTDTVIPFNDLIPVNPESTTDLNYYIEE